MYISMRIRFWIRLVRGWPLVFAGLTFFDSFAPCRIFTKISGSGATEHMRLDGV
jgi:hypothetical protein